MLHNSAFLLSKCRAEEPLVKLDKSAQQRPGVLGDLAASVQQYKYAPKIQVYAHPSKAAGAHGHSELQCIGPDNLNVAYGLHSIHSSLMLHGLTQHTRASCCKFSSPR